MREKKDGLMDMARAVGVWDPNEYYHHQLERADRQRRQRRDYWWGGLTFALLFGVYLLLAYSIGGTA